MLSYPSLNNAIYVINHEHSTKDWNCFVASVAILLRATVRPFGAHTESGFYQRDNSATALVSLTKGGTRSPKIGRYKEWAAHSPKTTAHRKPTEGAKMQTIHYECVTSSPRYSYNVLKVLQNSHNASFLLVLVKSYVPVYNRNGKLCSCSIT